MNRNWKAGTRRKKESTKERRKRKMNDATNPASREEKRVTRAFNFLSFFGFFSQTNLKDILQSEEIFQICFDLLTKTVFVVFLLFFFVYCSQHRARPNEEFWSYIVIFFWRCVSTTIIV